MALLFPKIFITTGPWLEEVIQRLKDNGEMHLRDLRYLLFLLQLIWRHVVERLVDQDWIVKGVDAIEHRHFSFL